MKNKNFQAKALYWASCNNLQLLVPGQAVLDICRSGSNDAAVADHLDEVQRLADDLYQDDLTNPWRPTAENIRRELKEYGAWDDSELTDDKQNWSRLLWIAAWNIYEDESRDCSPPISSVRKANRSDNQPKK